MEKTKVGKSSSHSKTNQGTGNVYGDGSENYLLPYHSPLHDEDIIGMPTDARSKFTGDTQLNEVPCQPEELPLPEEDATGKFEW